MCSFFSCIVTRGLRILFCEDDGHEELRFRAGLKDGKLEDRDFVRLEIVPTEIPVTSKGPIPLEWVYFVDEENTLPDWYLLEAKHIERAARILARTVAVKRQKWLREYHECVDEMHDKKDPVVKLYSEKYGDETDPGECAKIWEEWQNQIRPIDDYYDVKQKNLKFNYCESLADLPGYVKQRDKDGP